MKDIIWTVFQVDVCLVPSVCGEGLHRTADNLMMMDDIHDKHVIHDIDGIIDIHDINGIHDILDIHDMHGIHDMHDRHDIHGIHDMHNIHDMRCMTSIDGMTCSSSPW